MQRALLAVIFDCLSSGRACKVKLSLWLGEWSASRPGRSTYWTGG